MIELLDSHAHLNDEAYKEDLDKILQNCEKENVANIVVIGYNKVTSIEACDMADKYKNIYATIGLHPENIEEETDLSFIKQLSKNKKVVAIGEVGLDYHFNKENKEKQKEMFISQIKLANELGLPVAIHSRDADMDMLEVLKHNKIENGFVMHCFSSSLEIANEVIKLGGIISVGGVVTFKNAKTIIEVIKNISLDKIMLETDCPYLAPEPYRGKRNEPSFVKYVAEKIAELKEMTPEEVARITTDNAKRFYNIGGKL